ncbi:MAG: hypothetical protein SFX73_31235 [Kofleriaceae bacterium]|nr:hypothetical protein [Kofleriaceae bacterium]
MRFGVLIAVAGSACGNERAPSPSTHVGSGVAKPSETPQPTGVAEQGPHQDYPTPIGAGTDKLFFLEDPDRGPPAPEAYVVPARGSFAWTQHGACVLDIDGPLCTGTPGTLAWRVGRRKGLVVAESLVAGRIDETYVFEQNADGSPKQRVRLDQHGALVDAQLFAPGQRYSMRLANGGNGLSGCGYMAYKLDDRRRTIERGCLQWLGEPMLDRDGVATTRYVRDERGAIVEASRFGLNGAAIANADGVHRTRYEYDATGKLVADHHLGVDNAPARHADGCFGRRREYDERGLEQVSTCLDATGKPGPDADGIASHHFTYSEHGCLASKRYMDSDGRPIAHPDGDHGVDYTSDARCLVSSWTCVGSDSKPVACGPSRPATELSRRDAAGRIVAETFLDAAGHHTGEASLGALELRYRYDKRGNQTSTACYGLAGKPVECAGTGYHEERTEYDDVGRSTTTTFFDPSGAPTTNLGAASSKSRFDNYDHLAERRTFGLDGQPIEVLGMGLRRYLYDASHRQFAMLLYDAKEQPASYRACFTGTTCPGVPWHAVRYLRRGNGRLSAMMYFDAGGQLITTIDCTKSRCSD